MTGRAHNNNFREIPKFTNLSSSRNSQKLEPREYYEIYSMTDITLQYQGDDLGITQHVSFTNFVIIYYVQNHVISSIAHFYLKRSPCLCCNALDSG